MKHSKDYNSGYGQAVADVLDLLSEIERKTLAAERSPQVQEWSALNPEVVEARGKGLRTAVGWVRAGVKGLRKRKVG